MTSSRALVSDVYVFHPCFIRINTNDWLKVADHRYEMEECNCSADLALSKTQTSTNPCPGDLYVTLTFVFMSLLAYNLVLLITWCIYASCSSRMDSGMKPEPPRVLVANDEPPNKITIDSHTETSFYQEMDDNDDTKFCSSAEVGSCEYSSPYDSPRYVGDDTHFHEESLEHEYMASYHSTH